MRKQNNSNAPWFLYLMLTCILSASGALAQDAQTAPGPDMVPLPDATEKVPPVAEEPAPAEPTSSGSSDFIPLEINRVAGTFETTPSGERNLINVNVENESLENVVNMFTRISGANIVATSADLTGTVTVNLRDVEWQPALSSILDVHDLALEERMPGSGVYTIIPKPAKEDVPLVVDSIFLHYTTVGEMAPIVQSMLVAVTNASLTQFASRNALVLKTSEPNLEAVKKMVEKMDVPSKQVCVETQFMELNDEASRKLGIRWDSLDEYGMKLKPGPFSWDRKKERNKEIENGWPDYDRGYTYHETIDNKTGRESTSQDQSDSVRNYLLNGTSHEDLTRPEYIEDPDTGIHHIYQEVTPTVVKTGSRARTDTSSSDHSISQVNVNRIWDKFNRTITDQQAAVLEMDDFQMVLSALKKTQGVSVISNPKIIVTSGSKEAFFSVGDREPIIKTTLQTGTTESPGDQITAELDTGINTDYIKSGYLQTGISLHVIPVVKTDDMIQAYIEPSLIRKTGDKIVANNSWPELSVKEIKTEFTLRSSQTVAIGGLTYTSNDDAKSKIPFLGDIPLVGKYVFSHSAKVKKQTETIIFVTLTLANPDSLFQESGIPKRSKLVHKQLIRDQTDRQEFEKELEALQKASDESLSSQAKERLPKKNSL